MARRVVRTETGWALVRYYPIGSMVQEPYGGIIGDAPDGAIPFHRLFDVLAPSGGAPTR